MTQVQSRSDVSCARRHDASDAISVVIPLYNKAREIQRALKSVLRQTRSPSEVVVVDDGSTDGGAQVVKALRDPRIHVVVQANAGVSAARNRGVAVAASDWVAFLDADDEWLPDHLESIAALRDAHAQCDVLATAYVVRGRAGADRSLILRGGAPLGGHGVLKNYFDLAARSDPPICSSSVVVSRRALTSIGGFPTGIAQGEDLLTWARLAARFQIAYVTRPSVVVWQPQRDANVPTRRPELPDPLVGALEELSREVPAEMRTALRRYIGLWHKMRGTMFLRLDDRANAHAEFTCALRNSGPGLRLYGYLAMTQMPRAGAAASQRFIALLNRLRRSWKRVT
jgi:hypothetical protein